MVSLTGTENHRLDNAVAGLSLLRRQLVLILKLVNCLQQIFLDSLSQMRVLHHHGGVLLQDLNLRVVVRRSLLCNHDVVRRLLVVRVGELLRQCGRIEPVWRDAGPFARETNSVLRNLLSQGRVLVRLVSRVVLRGVLVHRA